MEGEQFISINPATLDDRNYFSYRDLQKLCLKLNLGANGKREELEDKLKVWNRGRSNSGVGMIGALNEFEENIPMNVEGNNFALLKVDVKLRNSCLVRRPSSCLLEDVDPLDTCHTSSVSPTLVRALSNNGTSTPGKSILKTPVKTPLQPQFNNNNNESIRKLDRITFSPFNGVKVIPNRTLDRSQWNTPSDSDSSRESSPHRNSRRNDNFCSMDYDVSGQL